MTPKKTRFGHLKLHVAHVVDAPPQLQRGEGSVINRLPEFKDVETIVAAVKEEGAAPLEAWKVFDLSEIKKKNPELRKMTTLVGNFASRVRELMKKQGVDNFLRLERRNKETYYLVGK